MTIVAPAEALHSRSPLVCMYVHMITKTHNKSDSLIPTIHRLLLCGGIENLYTAQRYNFLSVPLIITVIIIIIICAHQWPPPPGQQFLSFNEDVLNLHNILF